MKSSTIKNMTLGKIALLALVLFSQQSALAEPIDQLESGRYAVSKESSSFCDPISVGPLKGDEKVIPLNPQLSILTSATAKPRETKSDIDPKCVFVETVTRQNNQNSTSITMLNKEVCSEKIASQTVTKFVFTEDSIRMDLHEKGETPSKCIWRRVR